MLQAHTATGQTILGYCVLEELGSGSMGVVYKAEDNELGRFVALKFLPENAARNSLAKERLRREASEASALNHANICMIYEIGRHDGQAFIAMKYRDGVTLKYLIAAGTVDTERVVALPSRLLMRSTLRTAKASFIVTSNPPAFSSRSGGIPRFSISAWRKVFFRRIVQARSRHSLRNLCLGPR
jgi:serine/threonine protein kinase